MKKSNSIFVAKSLKNLMSKSLGWAILSYFLFGPITGMVLDGYDLNYFPERPFYLSLTVFVGGTISPNFARVP